MSDNNDSGKEAHRVGTINRWDAPEASWASEYDWTRHRGPPVFPVPGGWTLGFVEADGTRWRYCGDAGVGEAHDNDVDETEPGAYASLGNEPAEDVGLREEPDLEWTLKVDGVQVFRRVEPGRDDLYGATAQALHAYHTGDLDDCVDEIVPASGRKPKDVREQDELERRREENAGLDEFATDGGRPAEDGRAIAHLDAGDEVAVEGLGTGEVKRAEETPLLIGTEAEAIVRVNGKRVRLRENSIEHVSVAESFDGQTWEETRSNVEVTPVAE